MSRKAINVLFTIGSCLYVPAIAMIIWAYVILFQNSMQSAYPHDIGADPFSGVGTFMGFFWAGIMMISVGGVVLLVARIGALIEAGKAQEWVWFTLMIIFGWIVLFLYLIVGPKSEPVSRYIGYPPYSPAPGQPWGYVPGMMPPVQQSWSGYVPQGPGMMSPGQQPWSQHAPQGPEMMPPMQPWSGEASPPERQNMPEKAQE